MEVRWSTAGHGRCAGRWRRASEAEIWAVQLFLAGYGPPRSGAILILASAGAVQVPWCSSVPRRRPGRAPPSEFPTPPARSLPPRPCSQSRRREDLMEGCLAASRGCGRAASAELVVRVLSLWLEEGGSCRGFLPRFLGRGFLSSLLSPVGVSAATESSDEP